jgi:hypothetical protein
MKPNRLPLGEQATVSGHDNFPYDVFLSHNRAQKDWTRNLARLLKRWRLSSAFPKADGEEK